MTEQHSFTCPNCGAHHFGSSIDPKNPKGPRIYHCQGNEYGPSDLKPKPSCGWSGSYKFKSKPDEQTFGTARVKVDKPFDKKEAERIAKGIIGKATDNE